MTQELSDPSDLLVDLIRPYAEKRNLTVESSRLLRWIINSLQRGVGHRATLADLQDESVEKWILAMKREGLAAETIRGHRNTILALWRFAFETGSVDRLPGKTDEKLAAPEPASGPVEPSDGMTVSEFFQKVYRTSRAIRNNSAYQYEVAIRALDRWAGDPVKMADFNDRMFNAFLAHIVKGGNSPATLRNRRRHLLTIWSFGVAEGVCGSEPRKILKVETPWIPPRAWTHEEVRFLLRAAERLEGNYPDERWKASRGETGRFWRIGRKVVWGLLIRLAWDTGLRTGDILSLKLGQLGSDGVLEVVQSKTGRWHPTKVHLETLQFIHASFPPEREFIIPWFCTEEHFRNEFRKLVLSAAIGNGSFKKLRKSSATEVEKLFPGCGAAHLGHADGKAVARTHYLDPRLLAAEKPMPRPLRELAVTVKSKKRGKGK